MSLCNPPLLLALSLAFTGIASATPIDYTRDVVPLFDEHCIDCHAGSADEADGEFALDSFAALMKGGENGKAVLPGRAEESLLVKFLEGRSGKTGKNQFMPPGKKEHLKPEQIATIRQWIDEGAHGPSAANATPSDPLAKLPKLTSKVSTRPIRSVAVSADCNVIALGRFASVELRDGRSHKPLRTLSGIAGNANALAFSRDGQSLFVAAGDAGVSGIAYQFSVAEGRLLTKYQGHSDALHALALSPDGQWLATGGYDQKIQLWEARSGKPQRLLKGHNGSVNALSFRPDGKLLASASADRTIKLWDVLAGTRLDTLSAPTKEQLAVAFSHDGASLVAGGADSRIRLWSVPEKAVEGATKLLDTRFAHEGSVLLLAYSPDGKTLLSSASDRVLKLWRAENISETRAFKSQSDWVSAAAWASNETLVAARQDGTATLYEVASGKALPLASVSALHHSHSRQSSHHGQQSPPQRCQAPKPKAKEPAKAKAMAKAATPAAKPVAPVITRLFPPGFQAGGESVVRVTGTQLDKVTSAKASDARITFKLTPVSATELWLHVTAPAELPRAAYDVSLLSPTGESAKAKLYADHFAQGEANDTKLAGRSVDKAINYFGTLREVGQRDDFILTAKPGQTITLDLAAKAIGSKLVSPRLELFDNGNPRKLLASNSGLDSGADPFIAYTVPEGKGSDGKPLYFHAQVSETTLQGSPDNVYRLTIGALPVVVGWWPLAVKASSESDIHLVGFNLTKTTAKVKAPANGQATLPADSADYRSRVSLKVLASDLEETIEPELSQAAASSAAAKAAPLAFNGVLHTPSDPEEPDVDDFTFHASKGQTLVIETQADMLGSPADTKIEVLDAQQRPVPRLLLQAVRDSWINFRSVDANNPDARVENWREMDLNQFIYFQGDIARIFRLPRGPDSGFLFQSFNGKRRAYFDTTATGHALDEPCYVVEPHPLGTQLASNGLPVFTLNYANDDASDRRSGSDSRLFFTAPETADYLLRVTDSRGWSGPRFSYRATIREPQPDFAIALSIGDKGSTSLGLGAAAGFSVKATRKDGFEGEITIAITGLPAGFYASSPLVIEEGQEIANGSLWASPSASKTADWSQVKVTATASINGKQVSHPGNGFGKVSVIDKPKLIAILEPAVKDRPANRDIAANTEPLVITIAPGETKPVWLRAIRDGRDELLNFDIHSLPFGIIIDNIGLSGVAVRAGESEREVFLTCAKWVPEQDRLCHAAIISARNEQDSAGVQTSYPVLLRVRKH